MRIGIRSPRATLRAMSVVGAGLLAIVITLRHHDSRAGEPPQAETPVAVPGADVSTLFEQRCARCHDESGTGSRLRSSLRRLPDFTNVRWQQQSSDRQLIVSILEGKGAQMPAFAGRLTRAEARALVRHIRTLAPQEMVDVAEPGVPDFSERFRALEEEFERLRKQFHDLNAANK